MQKVNIEDYLCTLGRPGDEIALNSTLFYLNWSIMVLARFKSQFSDTELRL